MDKIHIVLKEKPTSFDSVLVLIKKNKKWLMVQNKKRAWEFVGGHREHQETFIETAQREALEEAQVKITNIKLRGYYILSNFKDSGKKHTTIITTAEIEEETQNELSAETFQKNWFVDLPQNLSFQDGLYLWLVKNIAI